MAGHRSTLKKNNKPFKSRHASKRSLKAANKGKVEKTPANNKAIRVVTKNERRNRNDQVKKNKIVRSIRERELFSGHKVERIITIIPLTSNIDSKQIIEQILSPIPTEELQFLNPVSDDNVQLITVKINRFKATLKFILPDLTNLINILDACKVADFVIFGLSAVEEVNEKYGEQIIRSVQAQGIATDYCVLPDLVSSYPKRNLQLDVYKSLNSYYEHFFPSNEKSFILENSNDQLHILRNLCQRFPHRITWRDTRGYMVADKLDKISIENNESFLVIEGIVRGSGFNPDNLIHIPGFGDRSIEKIEKLVIQQKKVDFEMDDDNVNIMIPSENRETLDELVENEQTDEQDYDISDMDEDFIEDEERDWNLVNEIQIAPKRRLPKGMSEYHARWYRDNELEEMIADVGLADESVDEDEDEINMDEDDETNMDEEIDDDDDQMDLEAMSPEEHSKQLEVYRKRERDELQWPDEIELKPEERATERLHKYRGVKSLASSIWDYDEYDEKRPENWLRYLRIDNYRHYRIQNIKKYQKAATVQAGDKVKIFIKFEDSAFAKFQDPKKLPFVIYGVLPDEHKLAVCNFEIKTWESYDEPIRSKEKMVVQYGFRRYHIEPLFSQLSRNPNRATKFQRFLHQGQVAFATAIVPISLTNSPALFFKENDAGSLEILAQGTFANSDYKRILAKRAVLTGEVFKIHKSMVTIRFMFFHPEDIRAYQKVPIFTKMGRSGFIRESLGTHGEFKASFDGKINQQDIVGMELFKRVWPKEGKEVLY
ncbi:Tsr1 protein [Martiniozyma asiatica (nom. inval.)]|nr:Tsr1 protein [Martiniozyma asiatica]